MCDGGGEEGIYFSDFAVNKKKEKTKRKTKKPGLKQTIQAVTERHCILTL